MRKKLLGAYLLLALCLHGASAWAYYSDRTPDPSWSSSDVTVSVYMHCTIDENTIGWPSASCNQPIMSLKKEDAFTSDRPFLAHGTLVMTDDRNLKDAAAIFQALQSDQATSPELKVVMRRWEYDNPKGWMQVRPSLVLQDFHAQVAEYMQLKGQLVHAEARRERIFYGLRLAIPLILLSLIALLARYVYRNRKRFWDRSAGSLLRWKGEVAQNLEDKRVRRIAIDEAVRLSVQNSVSAAKSGDTAELERMIASAIKRGDTEAAEALSAALERITGASRE